MREGACTGAAIMPQPSTLRLILNAAALVADEEGSSSKKAVFAATAKGAAPGVT